MNKLCEEKMTAGSIQKFNNLYDGTESLSEGPHMCRTPSPFAQKGRAPSSYVQICNFMRISADSPINIPPSPIFPHCLPILPSIHH